MSGDLDTSVRTCQRCGKPLFWTGRQKRRKYCSYVCSNAHHDFSSMGKKRADSRTEWTGNPGKRSSEEVERLRRIASVGGQKRVRDNPRRSKGEIALGESLKKHGYRVRQNVWDLVKDHEVDIYLPDLKVAISYNGPVHYQPIYGEGRLRQIQNRDAYKHRKLCEMGVRHIIVKESKRFSQKRAAVHLKWCLKQLDMVSN